MDGLIRRRFRVVDCAALLLLVVLTASGCKDNACESRPPEAQIDIRMIRLVDAALETEVRLSINGADPLVRTFAARSLSFVFELGELDQPPRELRIEVRMRDVDGNILSTDSLETRFLSNGCNFFSIDVEHVLEDAGVDTISSDLGPPRDVELDTPSDADAAIDADASSDLPGD